MINSPEVIIGAIECGCAILLFIYAIRLVRRGKAEETALENRFKDIKTRSEENIKSGEALIRKIQKTKS